MATEPIAAIKSARKRSVSMGVDHAWAVEFEAHPLAAVLSNHLDCIEVELKTAPTVDWLAILVWISTMAEAVNRHCDACRVVGDRAAEYWLHRFLSRCDAVARMDRL